LLWTYQQQDQFTAFKRQELWQYPRYKKIIEYFRDHYALTQFGFKELDKFLWRYGKDVFGLKKPAQPLRTDAHS